MQLIDIVMQAQPPAAWDKNGKIPWGDPQFSCRMLENHLSQDHDWASRRQSVIDRQTACIAAHVPDGARVLDLGCGPGLYTAKLATMGFTCTGVDFSPASIAYAKEQAALHSLAAEYILEDIRAYSHAGLFDAVLLAFGEINVFSKADARAILSLAAQSLGPKGKLFIEAHTYEEVQRQGCQEPAWHAYESGLFSASPHICLQKNFWDQTHATATTQYSIIDARTAECTQYLSSMSAYTDEEYRHLFTEAGFAAVRSIDTGDWPSGEHFAEKLVPFLCETPPR